MYPSYNYLDGAGNRYSISANQIKYDPVKPEFSSSGTYDGGNPYTININAAVFSEIKTLCEKLISNDALHLSKREMGTGKIIKRNHKDQTSASYIISRRNVAELDSYLKSLVPDQ